MNDLTKTTNGVPDFLGSSFGPTGFETVDNDSIAIPFLRLAQVNTPQVQPGTDKIDGLAAGMYFSPSISKVYGEAPRLVVVGFYRSWNIWNGEPPAAKFVSSISNDEFKADYEAKTHRDDKGKIVDDVGNRYVDTRNVFLFNADSPEDGVLLYPMSSTAIPASKRWNAKMAAIRVPGPDGRPEQVAMWSRIWTPKVDFVRGDKGSYYTPTDFKDQGWIPDSLVAAAKGAFEEAQAYVTNRANIVIKEADV